MNRLYDLLDNLIQLHKALYTLASHKKEVLLKGIVDELVAITRQEQKLIKGVTEAEAARQQVVKELTAQKGFALQEGTLAELIKLTTSAEEKMRLISCRNELSRIVTELRDANDLNQQLLEQSLSFVNMTLDLITDTPEDDFIYGKPTSDTYRQANRTFFNKKA
ncbi:flagellar protein FlgN [Brevibacillus fortis]|uniref:Flagellar biosynthesis protein FlgN n=1 Tax=Brevibacillus fortis TaxID=2126352 RepID=A0A2P7VGI9_9BACL|nr:flagellar protein FlgN [Brevibacillus fortis]PSJ98355.1 flagellar biosynthesis protein FlgN [Brevibacillus fortis]